MITFLPYAVFSESAQVLDRSRLGIQRWNVIQILDILHESEELSPLKITRWRDNPCVRMWRGYEPQLCYYGLIICEEWTKRGMQDKNCHSKINWHLNCATAANYTLDQPPWLGKSDFHKSHQSNLLRKDPMFYWNKFPGVPNDLPYVWPV